MNPAPPVTMIRIPSPSPRGFAAGSVSDGTDPPEPEGQFHARIVRLRFPLHGEPHVPAFAPREHRQTGGSVGKVAVFHGVVRLGMDAKPAQQAPREEAPDVFRKAPGHPVLGKEPVTVVPLVLPADRTDREGGFHRVEQRLGLEPPPLAGGGPAPPPCRSGPGTTGRRAPTDRRTGFPTGLSLRGRRPTRC